MADFHLDPPGAAALLDNPQQQPTVPVRAHDQARLEAFTTQLGTSVGEAIRSWVHTL